MTPLFRFFLKLCLLRAGPQELPASRFLLLLILLAHWLLGVALSLFSLPPGLAILLALSGTLLMLAVIHGMLLLRRRPHRFVQTATAMAGCELLLGLLALPLTAWFYSGNEQAIVSLLSLALMIWSLMISAHILRHALEVSMGAGVFVAIGYMILSYTVAGLIIG